MIHFFTYVLLVRYFILFKVAEFLFLLKNGRCNGVFTLSDTENETDTETDDNCTELNGNLCSSLSWCSVKCSAYYSGTHNYRSRYGYRSRSRYRSV